MTRINTNVPALLAQRVLGLHNRALTQTLERLSTGLRINRGGDDPAGLIASESLRAEQRAIAAAISNAERAEHLLNVAEGGLQEISDLLIELQSLVAQSADEAGVATEEREANQIQIDAILQTIDRLAGQTEFNGVKLLNGNFDYTTSGVASTITDLHINSARLGSAAGSFITVTVDTLASAQTAELYVSTGATLSNGGNGSITFEFTGTDGVQQFTFASGTAQADIIAAINTFTESLGISAAQSSAATGRVELHAVDFGSDDFVRVRQVQGTSDALIFATAAAVTGSTDLTDEGRDATLLINGIQTIANGLAARVANDGFDIDLAIDGASALNVDGASTSFAITGGGANFHLSPSISLSGKVSIGLGQVTTGTLGDGVNGRLAALRAGGTSNVVNGDLGTAQAIVDSAISQVAKLRGRLGAFQHYVIGSTINSLGVTLENITAAESAIRDTDYAEEIAELTRRQILIQATNQALLIANAQPQNVLALLM